jgi:hypothetical protein
VSAQGKVLATTAALITDDETGGYIQITTPDDIDIHVDMLTANGRSCTVWLRRTALGSDAAALLARPKLDEDEVPQP